MRYIGSLYAKLGGKYVKLREDTEYYDKIEAENAELKATIEKMKNCDNCKHLGASLWEDEREPCAICNKAEKWEIRK